MLGQAGFAWNQWFTAKKIYRLKEDQAFVLSLELGRRDKVVRHPSADFLPPLFMTDSDAPSLHRRGVVRIL